MRRTFAKELLQHARQDKNVILVTADLGYGMWNAFRDELPDQFYNVGAAEQSMMGIGVGLALEGKKPFVYSITPFLLYRPFETIRNYVDHEKIPVRMIGGGRDKDYAHDGFSHHAEEDKKVMNIFKNIQSYWPETKEDIPELVTRAVNNNYPLYINLTR